ncbi:putative amino acid permease [Yersinia intermedia]|uniref:Putative amino acid permease n=1 Tax=Yersinia intermedia TaxID=631 RepID=A0A0H5LS27_YERIN|nr:putative amino acid permease [Yersinia intermedia]
MTNNQPKPVAIKKLGIATLAIMNIVAVVSLRGLPAEAEYGLSSIFYYIFAAIFFLIPVSLVAAELATGWPEKGGVFRWIVSLLSILFVILPSVQAAFQILSQLTVLLYLVMYILMFSSAIYLRYSQPQRPRPYRIPGGDIGMWIIGGAGWIASIVVFLLSFVPPSQIAIGSPKTYVCILIIATLFFIILPLLIYAFRKPHWRDEKADFAPFTWQEANSHPGLPAESGNIATEGKTSHLVSGKTDK